MKRLHKDEKQLVEVYIKITRHRHPDLENKSGVPDRDDDEVGGSFWAASRQDDDTRSKKTD